MRIILLCTARYRVYLYMVIYVCKAYIYVQYIYILKLCVTARTCVYIYKYTALIYITYYVYYVYCRAQVQKLDFGKIKTQATRYRAENKIKVPWRYYIQLYIDCNIMRMSTTIFLNFQLQKIKIKTAKKIVQ